MRTLLPLVPTATRRGAIRTLAGLTAAALVLVAAPASAVGRAPVGFVDTVRASTGAVTVSGWAVDLDSASPIQVHVYAGSAFLGAVTAGGSRPDVAAAVGGSGAAGFSGTFVVAAGTYDICAYAIDPSGQGPNPRIGCVRTTISNELPRGFVDSATVSGTTGTVSGWALDPDTTASIGVHAYLDGSFVGSTTASSSRPDVGAAFGLGSAHGFSLSFPVPSGQHRVCLYGINAPTGVNPQFACATVVGGANATPMGALDLVTPGTSSVTAVGWALDPDSSASIPVQVYVDGALAGTGTANVERPDVAAAFSRGSQRGFQVTVPAAAGTHRVCVSAVNTPAGVNPTVGCANAVVAGTPAPTPTPTPPPTTAPAPQPSPGRTVVDGDLTVTTAGAVIDSADVRGYIRIQAPNVTIKNTIVRGRPGLTSNLGLINNTAGYAGLTIVDSELVASEPTPYVNGFVGSNATLLRVNVHGVVDSVHVTGDNVVVDSSWLHDNLHFESDPNQGGKASHDDNVQVQAGTNVVIRSSVLTGAKNAAIMVTQDRGPVRGLVVSGNRLDNGACTINLAEKTYGAIPATITGNAFGTAQVYKYCGVKAPATTTAVSTVTGNTFSDGRTFSVTP